MKAYTYLLLVAALFLTSHLFGQVEIAEKVAIELFHANGIISQDRPKVSIGESQNFPTLLDTETQAIQLDKKALTLCMEAKDQENALATLLAPDIATLYGQGNESSLIEETAYIGFMAGYNTLNQEAETLWGKCHDLYPDLSAKISMETRRANMTAAKEKLASFIPVYELANYYMVIGEYKYAEKYFQHIQAKFPSREVYSNLGVSRALQALDLFGIGELKYVYPFLIDLDFRVGSKGEKEDRDSLLMVARDNFREAINRDPQYAIGYVNLSCTLSLLEDYSESITQARKARELARDQKLDRVEGSALIALGIAYAKSEGESSANASSAFSEAANIEDESVQKLVKLNQNVEVSRGSQQSFWDDESIGGKTMENVSTAYLYGSEDIGNPAIGVQVREGLNLFSWQEEGYSWMLQEDLGEEGSQDDTYFFFSTTADGYTGKSVGEISQGADITEVEDAYGTPSVVRKYGRGKFYFYASTNILFRIDQDDMVQSWTLFQKK